MHNLHDTSRRDTLSAKIAGSLKADGTPLKGYTRNVAALRAEVSRLDAVTARAVAAKNLAEESAIPTPLDTSPGHA